MAKTQNGSPALARAEDPIELFLEAQKSFSDPRKTAEVLSVSLGIHTLKQLEQAAKDSRIRKIPGFGRKTEDVILKGFGLLRTQKGRARLHDVHTLAEELVRDLRQADRAATISIAGSLRRGQETIKDINLVATSPSLTKLKQAFRTHPSILRILSSSPSLITAQTRFGVRAELHLVKKPFFGSTLLHVTGSKTHNALLRKKASAQGFTLIEGRLYQGKKHVPVKTEEELYARLGLAWIPPELREYPEVIEQALEDRLPKLLPHNALKGDLQVQTTWTDGSGTIEEMARAAKAVGLSYIAVTDHTRTMAITGGLDPKRLAAQGKEIDALNARLKGFRIFKSSECDIRKDGTLDLPDQALKTLDLVGISIHTHFDLDRETQTKRLIRAMKNPYANILFHPTGRIVNAREEYDVDMLRIIRAAKQYGVALEVNGSERLDMRDVYVRMALQEGVKLVVDSDAHAATHFAHLPFGVTMARRGAAERQRKTY